MEIIEFCVWPDEFEITEFRKAYSQMKYSFGQTVALSGFVADTGRISDFITATRAKMNQGTFELL